MNYTRETRESEGEVHPPSCPVCQSRDAVERHRSNWVCTGCWTVFTGSRDEWERSHDHRDQYAALQRKGNA